MKERLQKFLSRAGVASRRQAEKLILSGRVAVNGRIVRELGIKINPDRDKVVVNGQKISVPANLIYLALNKPSGYVSSRQDRFGRKTVYDLLPENLRRVVWNVGRLDYETEGLLLFTNDGDLTNKLTHPRFEHEKEYEVILDKPLKAKDKKLLEAGIKIDDYLTSPAKVIIKNDRVVNITIHEGKKHQVRRMFSSLGYTVRRLTRTRVGKLRLTALNLKIGEIRFVKKDDIM